MTGGRRFGAWAAWLVALLLAGAAPAPAQDRPPTAVEDDYILRLVKAASDMRVTGVMSPADIPARYSPGAASHPDFSIPGLEGRDLDEFWSQFFENSQVMVGHVQHPTPVAGYYNVVLDFWLLTQWDNRSQRPVLTHTALVPGASMVLGDGDGVPIAPQWALALNDQTPVEALRNVGALSATAFETRYPFASDAPPVVAPSAGVNAREILRERTAAMLAPVLDLTGRPALGVYNSAMRALADGDLATLQALMEPDGDAALEDLVSLPEILRAGMRPAAVINQDNVWIIVSGNPISGRFFTVGVLVERTGRPPRFAALGMVDAMPENAP